MLLIWWHPPNDFPTALFNYFPMFYFSLSPFFVFANDHPLSSIYTQQISLFSTFSILSQLSCSAVASAVARWLISPCFTFPDKAGASLDSPNTSVTAAPQPKQATAMKSVLAGFGSGVSKPPNRSSPAPAAAQNQVAQNPAPNPASAFSGLVNNISKSKDQGSSSSFARGFSFGLPPPLWSWFLEWIWWDRNVQTRYLVMKRDQIFDWTDYLNSTLTLDRWRDIFKTFKQPSPYKWSK